MFSPNSPTSTRESGTFCVFPGAWVSATASSPKKAHVPMMTPSSPTYVCIRRPPAVLEQQLRVRFNDLFLEQLTFIRPPIDHAALHDQPHIPQRRNVPRRITFYRDQVGQHPA